MPSSYTPTLRLTQPATGELDGTWGDVVNQQITAMIEQAITGKATVAMADASQTLTTVNGATDQARCMMVECTGALTADRNVVCPAVTKMYIVNNLTSGGHNIVFKTSGGTGVTIPPSGVYIVYCDATNVVATNISVALTAIVLATPRAIYGNNFDGSAALGQIIASAYGGTGNGFAKFTGPSTSEKTFTLPNANASLAILGANTFTDEQSFLNTDWTVVAKGSISNATVTFTVSAGMKQSYTATGSTVTIATAGWPTTGHLGELLIEATNAGLYTHSWPTINWIKPDGTTTTSIATYLAANGTRTALQSAGVDYIALWSSDSGTTIYGKLV